jgi:hypothetical protein
MQQATFYRTIAEWNTIYSKLECFPHPNAYVQCGKRPLPRLLEIFPDAKEQIVAFGVRKLAMLTIESKCARLHCLYSYSKFGTTMEKR